METLCLEKQARHRRPTLRALSCGISLGWPRRIRLERTGRGWGKGDQQVIVSQARSWVDLLCSLSEGDPRPQLCTVSFKHLDGSLKASVSPSWQLVPTYPRPQGAGKLQAVCCMAEHRQSPATRYPLAKVLCPKPMSRRIWEGQVLAYGKRKQEFPVDGEL